MTTQNVKENLNSNEFIKFSFADFKTKMVNGEEKKDFTPPQGWSNLTKSSLNQEHINIGILTGEINNLTVIDYDDKNVFNEDNIKFKFFQNNYYIVETKNGYHIYFNYVNIDSALKIGESKKIDFLNNGRFVIAPPTRYNTLNGDLVKYKEKKGGIKKDMPQDLINYIQGLIDIKKGIIKPIEESKNENAGFGIIPVENKQCKYKMTADDYIPYMDDILDCLNTSRADDREYWINIGMILKKYGCDSGLYHNFSSRSGKYEKKNCDYTWNTLNADNALNIGTLLLYAKTDNPSKLEDIKKTIYEKNNVKKIENKKVDVKADIKVDEKVDENNIFNNELYIKQKKEFEEIHGAFKLENPMSYCVFDKTNNEIVQYKKADISTFCEDRFDRIQINEKKFKSFIDVWYEDKNKKRYKKMVFDPSNITNDINYNHFKGFKYDTDLNIDGLKDEDFAFFKLLRFLSPTDTEYDFTKSWFSHILKSPEKKTNCAIVLYSKLEGVGKNMLIDTFIKLIDDYYGLIKQIEDIKKNFNVDLCNKFLIYGDEITANAKLLVDRIKDSITASKIKLEKKGFDAITLRDYSNWIFTTNNENCFKISPEDRRFFMFHCNEEKQKPEFYDEVVREMNDPLIMHKLFKYLKNYDDNNIFKIGSGIIPKTEYKNELIMADKPAYIQMFYKKSDLFTNRQCKSADLFKETQIYAKNNYLSSNYSLTTFGTYMTKIFGLYKKRSNGGIIFDMPCEDEYLKLLYEADKEYYKYINGFQKNENPFEDEKK